MIGNSAGPDDHGGAIYSQPKNKMVLKDCTIKENYPDDIYQEGTRVFVDERNRDPIDINEHVPLQF